LTSTYYIRWTRPNGYQILPPYGDLPNDPWFPRVGFNINPWAPEWARQLFNPQPPFLLATWVPGKVLSPSIIEFERKRVFFAGGHYPDVLVFDKDYNLKYALAGAQGKGLLYNWKYHQFVAIDTLLARVQVAVSLDTTDICYGFYPYQEPDIVYTDLDVNPFTNQNVRNRIVVGATAVRIVATPGFCVSTDLRKPPCLRGSGIFSLLKPGWIAFREALP